ADPDDLFLTPHPAVGAGVAARPLADRQSVLDDPREVPGRDARRPLPLHAAPSLMLQSPDAPPAPWRARRGREPWPRPSPWPTRPAPASPPAGRRRGRRPSAGR